MGMSRGHGRVSAGYGARHVEELAVYSATRLNSTVQYGTVSSALHLLPY